MHFLISRVSLESYFPYQGKTVVVFKEMDRAFSPFFARHFSPRLSAWADMFRAFGT